MENNPSSLKTKKPFDGGGTAFIGIMILLGIAFNMMFSENFKVAMPPNPQVNTDQVMAKISLTASH
ncbi:MAG: hypothetical protein NT091_02915 [Candidatus Falkowbacteria bacterium]|nr:hypothetical protein [Candidatus Falkowbacteria bacterium]